MSSSRIALLAALASAATLAACDVARPVANGGNACASCHGFPPPPGAPGSGTDASTHPNSTDCHACHPQTVDANGNLIPASAGGLHENGTVEAQGHPAGFANPDPHGPAADGGIAACQACHGADFAGGSTGVSCNACHATNGFDKWQSNCTFCHGAQQATYSATTDLNKAAPPEGVHGETLASDPHVGAHQRHLAPTYTNAIACGTCHVVPTDLGHVNGVTTVTFTGVATGGAWTSGTCAVYCHGQTLPGTGATNETPAWTQTGVSCTWCHSTNPTTGEHQLHIGRGYACSECHGTGYSSTTVVKATHVNGTVEKDPSLNWNSQAKSCDPSCHGSESW
jgi:predicted CxxxxCH...CXXCH cytochrome family protein